MAEPPREERIKAATPTTVLRLTIDPATVAAYLDATSTWVPLDQPAKGGARA